MNINFEIRLFYFGTSFWDEPHASKIDCSQEFEIVVQNAFALDVTAIGTYVGKVYFSCRFENIIDNDVRVTGPGAVQNFEVGEQFNLVFLCRKIHLLDLQQFWWNVVEFQILEINVAEQAILFFE